MHVQSRIALFVQFIRAYSDLLEYPNLFGIYGIYIYTRLLLLLHERPEYRVFSRPFVQQYNMSLICPNPSIIWSEEVEITCCEITHHASNELRDKFKVHHIIAVTRAYSLYTFLLLAGFSFFFLTRKLLPSLMFELLPWVFESSFLRASCFTSEQPGLPPRWQPVKPSRSLITFL